MFRSTDFEVRVGKLLCHHFSTDDAETSGAYCRHARYVVVLQRVLFYRPSASATPCLPYSAIE